MSFGKLYSYPDNPRTTSLLVAAKASGLDVEFVHEEPSKGVSAGYTKLNALGKVPTFQGADGFVLSECIAIAVYLTAQNEKTTLLGKTKQDYASILRWMSFANSEVLSPLGAWFRPLIGRDPYNKKNVESAQAAALKSIGVVESHLTLNTFLVGERLSLADIFAASIFARGFQFVFDKEFRAQFPNVTRWYDLIRNQDVYKAVAGDVKYIDEAVKYTPPKKEPKPAAAPKPAAPKPAAPKPAAQDDEEEPVQEAPKAKHPLEALGRPTLALDDWKRKYSNDDTRSVALPWFWENYKPEDYSLWKVEYKYNGGVKWGLVAHTIAMFVFVTIYTAITLDIQSISFINNQDFHGTTTDIAIPPGPIGYQWFIHFEAISIVPNVVLALNTWLADGLLLYRCYVVYAMSHWAIVIPCIMYFGCIGTGILFLYQISQREMIVLTLDTSVKFGTPFFSTTFSLNVLLTLMIIIRLVLHRKHIRDAMGATAGAGGLYKAIITILIESSALWVLSFISYVIPWAAKSFYQYIFFQINSQLQVIAPFLITLRVANRRALASNTAFSGNVSSIRFGSQGKHTDSGETPPSGFSTGLMDEAAELSVGIEETIDLNHDRDSGSDGSSKT